MNATGSAISQIYFQQRINGEAPQQQDSFNRANVLRHYNGDGTMVTESSLNPNQTRVRSTTGTERIAVQQASEVKNIQDDDSSQRLGLTIDTYA